LFAVTTSQQCAEDLPYGPTDKLLPLTGEGGEDNPILASPAPGYDPALLKATKDKNGAPKTGFYPRAASSVFSTAIQTTWAFSSGTNSEKYSI
jgi:hypothetical protein